MMVTLILSDGGENIAFRWFFGLKIEMFLEQRRNCVSHASAGTVLGVFNIVFSAKSPVNDATAVCKQQIRSRLVF